MNYFNAGVQCEEAIFAMGCFWCAESAFRDHDTYSPLKGIMGICAGYAGGTRPNPTYESHAGYKEAVQILFDPGIMHYYQLLDIFWHNIDFFDDSGQFCDKGFSYTSAVFYQDNTQRVEAEQSKQKLEGQFKRTLKTEILPVSTFCRAEGYHQNYQAQSPVCYNDYRRNCGRDNRLKEIWSEVKSRLENH